MGAKVNKDDLEKLADFTVQEIQQTIREHKMKTCVRLQAVREILDPQIEIIITPLRKTRKI